MYGFNLVIQQYFLKNWKKKENDFLKILSTCDFQSIAFLDETIETQELPESVYRKKNWKNK